MALANYTDLQAAIANWLSRPDLAAGGVNVARVPEIVTLAEARINTDLKVSTISTKVTVAMTLGNVATTWPTDTRVIRSAKITTFTPPHELTFYPVEDFAKVQCSGQGEPTFYTIRDAIEWNQAPDQAYSVEIEYFPRLNLASSTTNWLMTALPNVYLYACLMVATGRNKDLEAFQSWKAQYEEDIPRAKRLLMQVVGNDDGAATFDTPAMDNPGSYNVLTD